jgi:hypothetical protein
MVVAGGGRPGSPTSVVAPVRIVSETAPADTSSR